MSELKQARDEFEDYVGWKPPRWKLGCNGETYYDPAIENRWQDFLQGWNRRTQPEATKLAQDLQLVVATSTETGFFHVVINVNDGKRSLALYDKQHSLNGDTVGVADIPAAALASPADALVAGDRVDAELREALEELYYALPDILPAAGYKRLQETGQWSSKTTWDLRGHTGEVKYRADDMQSVYAAMDRVRAAIQAQKDGHG